MNILSKYDNDNHIMDEMESKDLKLHLKKDSSLEEINFDIFAPLRNIESHTSIGIDSKLFSCDIFNVLFY